MTYSGIYCEYQLIQLHSYRALGEEPPLPVSRQELPLAAMDRKAIRLTPQSTPPEFTLPLPLQEIEQEFTVWVPGHVVPWKRAAGRGSRRFTPAVSRAYQQKVGTYVRDALPDDWDTDQRYEVEFTPVFVDYGKRDLDNVCKQVCDAMEGIVYNNDCRIDQVVLRRAVSASVEGILITVRRRDQGVGREWCREVASWVRGWLSAGEEE